MFSASSHRLRLRFLRYGVAVLACVSGQLVRAQTIVTYAVPAPQPQTVTVVPVNVAVPDLANAYSATQLVTVWNAQLGQYVLVPSAQVVATVPTQQVVVPQAPPTVLGLGGCATRQWVSPGNVGGAVPVNVSWPQQSQYVSYPQ
jgi:hypothetical protein